MHAQTGEGRSLPEFVSVVVPVFNEQATIGEILRRIRSVPIPTQVIVVDDGSSDGTAELLQAEADANLIQLVIHPRNLGKGAAVRSGLARVRGAMVIIQDGDLEYDPADYPSLLAPIQQGIANVVYGSRFLESHPEMSFWHSVGNRMLTLTCNMLFGAHLTDIETGYKVLTAEVAESLQLRSDGWGFDPEITAKLLKGGHRIHEVPISYVGRKFRDGKKITWKDGMIVTATLVKYRFVD